MSDKQVWYLEFDDKGNILKAGCMVCNKTLAVREDNKVTREPFLKHMSHMRLKYLPLMDGSQLEVMLCPDCENKPIDNAVMERTVRWGFMQETLAATGQRPELKVNVKIAADIGRRLKIKRG